MIRDISGKLYFHSEMTGMTLNDRYFSEVHLVHYKEEYGTIGDSLDKGDGLAVLGFFIETG